MSVLSPTVQLASMQPPPMPIQSDEDSSPDACWLAVGTVQSPAIELNCLPPCSSVPWLYPNQLLLELALARSPGLTTCTIAPCDRGAADACAASAPHRAALTSAVPSTTLPRWGMRSMSLLVWLSTPAAQVPRGAHSDALSESGRAGVAKERLGVDRAAGHALHQGLRVHPPAVAMDVLAEPRADRLDVAAA